MANFWSKIKLTQSDRRGAVTIALLLIVVVVIVATSRRNSTEEISATINEQQKPKSEGEKISIQEFDPNTVELRQLLEMGFTKYQALSLLRYRASGKTFRIKEEVIGCYGISDSLYFAIEPYIKISEEFQFKPKEAKSQYNTSQTPKQQSNERASKRHIAPSPFLIDTVSEEYLTAIGALTPRQAEVFIKWRDMSGIESLEQLKKCYTVSDSIAEWLATYAIFSPKQKAPPRDSINTKPQLIELNSADSAQLISIYGIGAKSAAAIIKHREKLGGFHSEKQLSEIKIITESNLEKILQQIFINNSDLLKIDVNFATAKQLSAHPYFTPLKIRRLLKIRELKGGWRTTEEMIEDKIFTKEEAQQVHPYLHFEVLEPLTE